MVMTLLHHPPGSSSIIVPPTTRVNIPSCTNCPPNLIFSAQSLASLLMLNSLEIFFQFYQPSVSWCSLIFLHLSFCFFEGNIYLVCCPHWRHWGEIDDPGGWKRSDWVSRYFFVVVCVYSSNSADSAVCMQEPNPRWLSNMTAHAKWYMKCVRNPRSIVVGCWPCSLNYAGLAVCV